MDLGIIPQNNIFSTGSQSPTAVLHGSCVGFLALAFEVNLAFWIAGIEIGWSMG